MILGLLLYVSQALNYTYWIEPCWIEPGARPKSTACQSGDSQLAQWAFEAWQSGSTGRLTMTKTSDPQKARIRLYWADAQQGMYGEARFVAGSEGRVAEVYVRPAPLQPEDPLLRDAVVYLTCVHEIGHALGLPHTSDFQDIMYSFQFGGDIPEYFGRYRRRLKARGDIRDTSALSAPDRRRLLTAIVPNP